MNIPKVFYSSITQKIVMALTGLFLCLFLLIHLAGNLQLLLPQAKAQLQYNYYSHVLSNSIIIKIASYITYFFLLLHCVYAWLLTRKNRQVRSVHYACNRPQHSSKWASRNMGILGVILLFFLIIHMKTFWYVYHWGSIGIDSQGYRDLYDIVIKAFSHLWYVVLYVFCMIAMGYHLVHGVASAFSSLGLHHKKYSYFARQLGFFFAIAVSFGFAFIPISVFLQQSG